MKALKAIMRACYIGAFLCLLLIPLCHTNVEKNVISELDNRELVEFPQIEDEDYTENVDKYLQDRIGFRSEMVTGYQILNEKMTGELDHPLYEKGKAGYIFFHMHDNVVFGDFHKTFARAVKKMQDYCESRGAEFYFLFDPEKISVYRRFLPAGVNYNDEWVDEMMTYMEELGIHHVISNRDLLIDKSREEQVFNVKYDAGHWNDLGCFYGTNNLWKAMNRDFPEVTEYSKDEFDISTAVGQYLSNSKFPLNEVVPSFSIKTRWDSLTHIYQGIRLHENYNYFNYFVNIAEDANKYPRTMIFHGSYYNRNPQFFVGRTREYIGIHDYQNVLNLDYYFNIFKPEAVVFEVAEYTFSDTYFDSTAMDSLEYNPGLLENGLTVQDAIQKAKNEAEKIQSNIGLRIVPGIGIDTVYFDSVFPDAECIYLFSDDSIFDMIRDANGTYKADVLHGSLEKTCCVYCITPDGQKYYYDTVVGETENFVRDMKYSEGASYDDASKEITLITDVEGNRFDQVDLQLIDGKSGGYLDKIDSSDTVGLKAAVYTHELDTGEYIIRLKGNANLQDVYFDIRAFLQRGKGYEYSYNVVSLDWNRIVLSDYSFSGLGQSVHAGSRDG